MNLKTCTWKLAFSIIYKSGKYIIEKIEIDLTLRNIYDYKKNCRQNNSYNPTLVGFSLYFNNPNLRLKWNLVSDILSTCVKNLVCSPH